ncbi:hypothetical protein ACHAXS_007940 [Conticribra weissflogii]
MRIIMNVAEAEKWNRPVWFSKLDIKDGFWRLNARKGEEFAFAYVLPSEHNTAQLVVPTSLQMGWIESPACFCTATETARDVAEQLVNSPLLTGAPHKFEHWLHNNSTWPDHTPPDNLAHLPLMFSIEVYVDDFIVLVCGETQQELQHVGRSVLSAIHSVFPEDAMDDNDPISLKKLKQGDGKWDHIKTILGFQFDGEQYTVCVEPTKLAQLIASIHTWLSSNSGIAFHDFEVVIAKIRHAFTVIPGGRGLLTPCNCILSKRPPMVYLHRNRPLRRAIRDMHVLLQEAVAMPIKCRQLIPGTPHFLAFCDASGAGFGGVILGEGEQCPPTVFRGQWPAKLASNLVSAHNRTGGISISDLELAALFIATVIMEQVCPSLTNQHLGLFSDNSPTVSWAERMAARNSDPAGHLLRALTLRLHANRASPLAIQHIAGKRNVLADIPSRSFGSEPQWHCHTDAKLK